MRKKQWGSPLVAVRVPRPLHRKVQAVAKLYNAPLPVFVRDTLEAVCGGDIGKAQAFELRLARAVVAHRQRELDLGDGLILSAPQGAKR
jgi:hypothetical protein